MNELGEHESGKGEKVQALERLRQTFVVASQTAKACSPAEGAFNDPTTRQQDEPLFGFRQLDDHQAEVVVGGGLLG